MAGRVYGLCGTPGVRDARGCRVFSVTGEKVPFVIRVEFDADTSEGFATLELIVRDETGRPLVDYEKGNVCRATVRTWVRVCEKDESDPKRTPDRMLWKQEDGTLAAHTDPLPEVPFTEEAARA